MKTGGTLYRTATVTVRQFYLNRNVWAVTWKADDEWAEIKDRLKELLWMFEYKYDSNSKSWLISKSYERQLQSVLLSMFQLENINWPGNAYIGARQADARRKQDQERSNKQRRQEEQQRERREEDAYARREREYGQRRHSYSTPNSTQNDPYSVLMVTRSAPLGLCEAAYRYWAKETHPDTGGNHEQMKAFNNAIAEIRRVKGK